MRTTHNIRCLFQHRVQISPCAILRTFQGRAIITLPILVEGSITRILQRERIQNIIDIPCSQENRIGNLLHIGRGIRKRTISFNGRRSIRSFGSALRSTGCSLTLRSFLTFSFWQGGEKGRWVPCLHKPWPDDYASYS